MNKKYCLAFSIVASLLFTIIACQKKGINLDGVCSEIVTTSNDFSLYDFSLSQGNNSSSSSGAFEKSDLCSTKYSENGYYEYVGGQIHFSITNSINMRLKKIDSYFDESKEINCVLKLADNYSHNQKSTPLIMLCHGWKGTVTDNQWYSDSEESTDLINYFCSNGFNVYDVNSTDGIERSAYPDLGCIELINSYLNAYDYIVSKYNVSDLFTYSMSFGTFSCLNIIQLVPNFIKASVLTGPRSSYEKMWEVNDSFKRSISAKFGFDDKTGSTYEYDKMEKYDLYRRILNKTKISLEMPPSIWMFGDSSLDDFTDECTYTIIDYLENNCYDVEHLRVDNFDHTNICYIQKLELREKCVNFFRNNLSDGFSR